MLTPPLPCRLPLYFPLAPLHAQLVAKNRFALGGGLDAVMALGKISMEEKGEGSCAEHDECRVQVRLLRGGGGVGG